MSNVDGVASGTKKLGARYSAHLAETLIKLMRERFEGNQTRMAEHVGMSQSQVSALLRGERSVGINVLIRLRTRLDVSIDDLIGLPPLRHRVPPPELEDAISRALEKKFPSGSPEPLRLPAAHLPPKRRKRDGA